MCSVLEFSGESDKLRTLFSKSNHFDSILFIFDGGRRYKDFVFQPWYPFLRTCFSL